MTHRPTPAHEIEARAFRLFDGQFTEPAPLDAVEALRQMTVAISSGAPIPPDLIRDARHAIQQADLQAAASRRTARFLRLVKS